MARYYVNGTLTFSSQTNRNGAESSIASALSSSHPDAVEWGGGTYTAGMNRVGSTGLTLAFEVPDEGSAVALQASIMAAIASRARTAGHVSVSRAGP